MNRCPTHSHKHPRFHPLASVVLAVAALLAAPAVLAQDALGPVQTQHEAALGGRNFPVGTLRGRMAFGVFPEIELDGQGQRLAPGSRIRNPQNMLVVPATLTGQYLAVNYRRDAAGMVSDVWILTPEEASAERTSAAGKPLLNMWPFVSRAENETR